MTDEAADYWNDVSDAHCWHEVDFTIPSDEENPKQRYVTANAGDEGNPSLVFVGF
jgi:hypothetical protein